MASRTIELDLRRAARVVKSHPEILAAYLYGSHAKGHAGPQSDVDVAVLLRERRGRMRRIPATYEADLANAISAAVGRSVVEVIVLNTASPLLAREVLRGHRFFTRERDAVMAYEYRIRQRYIDTAHLRAIQDRCLDAVIRRGFSKAVGR
jgi:predicted nucleotidyltransferase